LADNAGLKVENLRVVTLKSEEEVNSVVMLSSCSVPVTTSQGSKNANDEDTDYLFEAYCINMIEACPFPHNDFNSLRLIIGSTFRIINHLGEVNFPRAALVCSELPHLPSTRH
jgi:hypothetical protein